MTHYIVQVDASFGDHEASDRTLIMADSPFEAKRIALQSSCYNDDDMAHFDEIKDENEFGRWAHFDTYSLRCRGDAVLVDKADVETLIKYL